MVDLDASPHDVKISQTVTGLATGQTYDLRFEAGAPYPESAHLEVWFGGVKVGDIAPTGQMQEYTITLIGGSGAITATCLNSAKPARRTIRAPISPTSRSATSSSTRRPASRRIRTRSTRSPVIAVRPRSPIRAPIRTWRRSSRQGTTAAVTVDRQFRRRRSKAAQRQRDGSIRCTDDQSYRLGPDHHRRARQIHLFNETYNGVGFVVGRYDSDGDRQHRRQRRCGLCIPIDPATGVLSLVQYVSLHQPNTAQQRRRRVPEYRLAVGQGHHHRRRRRHRDADRRYLRQHPLRR